MERYCPQRKAARGVEFENERVGEHAANGARFDIIAFGRAAPCAQTVPIGVEFAAGGQFHGDLRPSRVPIRDAADGAMQKLQEACRERLPSVSSNPVRCVKIKSRMRLLACGAARIVSALTNMRTRRALLRRWACKDRRIASARRALHPREAIGKVLAPAPDRGRARNETRESPPGLSLFIWPAFWLMRPL